MAALQDKEILWPQQREEPGVEYYEDQKGHRRGGEEEDDINIDIHTGHGGATIRYLPLHHVYSATSPVMSKKIKAQKQQQTSVASDQKPSFVHVYSRRHSTKPNSSFYDRITSCSQPIKIDQCDHEVDGLCVKSEWKRKRIGSSELVKPGVGSEDVLRNLRITRFREARAKDNNSDVNGKDDSCTNNVVNSRKRKHNCTENLHEAGAKKWAWLCFDGVDPKTFIRLKCKVYWPLDDDWYAGSVVGYDPESRRHHVKYDDGDEEHLFLRNERVKFCVSHEDMQRLNLNYGVKSMDSYGIDYGEMVVLAASLEYSQELEPGDIVWAKLTGHAMWPAVLVNQTSITSRKGTNKDSGCKSVPVQFFGTYDFARVNTKQVISFLRGLLSSFHLKCKKSHFARSLEEAKMYLSGQKLPKRMLRLQNGMDADVCDSGEDEQSIDSNEDCEGNEKKNELEEGINCFPFKFGDLQVINLGKIVKDSDYFRDEKFIWPEGYTAVRKFTSVTDPSMCTLYKMEVLRDADLKFRPLFRVTSDNGEQFKGPTPSACWNKIYRRIRKTLNDTSNGYGVEGQPGSMFKSGSYMFGFPNPKISKLIQELSSPKLTSHFSACKRTKTYQDAPAGYRPVRVDWKDLDKCSVCHTDEEYENNLFLQCEKCRMMVHARCYGELEPVDGVLWLCNLCRSGAPVPPPPCCLCPVIAGAMKPTTDGRWAHLACAIWIPETCLSDIKRMEPIDGLSRIHKDRWKLLCSICGVSYGACIQCSDSTCRVAYHPLCARAAGLCIELEDEDRLHLASMDEDDPEGSIRLLSFCKKHRRPSNEHLAAEERIGQVTHQCSDYTPPSNPSGCARTEPYNSFGRRGRKEPEAIAAASSKRLFVENQPYLVCGYCHHESAGSKYSFTMQKLKNLQLNGPKGILSVAEKYRHMKDTFRRRLTFGKSRIHGFGIFAKHPHKAGDMVIEYTGELVRPSIADRRERLIYNSLVGAGTYMFRIDDARVIDATRMGSVAHLINHSCEPNCYSRVISVNGDEHIIIFAKRDIRQWEELTYDYRFFSIDEQLACYCDFPRCRGVVNDVEAQEAMANLYAPRSELIDWRRQ